MALRNGASGPSFHKVKGRIMRFLGWMTADRHVEAEGEAEARTGAKPSDSTVRAVEHEVKEAYDEAFDPREGRGGPVR